MPSLLRKIAEDVSDGSTVDWKGAEEKATGPQRPALHELRVIDEVSRFHRCEDSLAPTVSLHSPAGYPSPALGTWNGFELLEEVGRGGFGRVYLALDPKLDREVALKLIELEQFRSKDAEEFLREGRLLARVRHNNVAQVHGADVAEGRAGLWMEFIHGQTLETVLEGQGPFSASEAAGIGVELCRALAAIHGEGLIHRDVKTANVMRERGGRLVLMDLGAGLDLAREAARAGEATGTPFFMAPETLLGGSASERSDLYSVGVVLFRLVSASYPVEAATIPDLIEAHRTGERRTLRDTRPDLPTEFIQVVERVTAADPAKRYATAGALQAALESITGTTPQPGGDETRPAVVRPGRRTWAVAGVTVALLAVALLVVWLQRPSPPFEVEAGLYRSTPAGRQWLGETDRLALGDRLSLDLQASTPVHVYVLNRDERGATHLLFPLPGLEPANPLPPGVRHRLPGSLDGRNQSWVVNSAGTTEHFLVVASRSPLSELEADLAALPRPTAGAALRYPRVSEGAERRLRSVGGLAEDDSPAHAADPFGRIEALGAGAGQARDTWIRRITLRNP